ncbi:MAG: Crp/Fnr family transcriptional regulator [Chloroflexi bacterium]|nr:MAG: Crp/Fnr family transcriptional regulator [Chloroflexota bacterium]
MQSLNKLLTENQVFGALSESERMHISEQAHHRSYARGEWLAHREDVWPYLFLVGSGSISGFKESSEGRSLIVLTLTSGDLFWGAAFFEDDSSMLIGLQAQQDCQIYLWSRAQLLPLLLANGRFSWNLSRLMLRRMLQGSAFMESLAFQPVRERLANLLLNQYGAAEDEFVPRDLTLDEMAAHLGTKREVICRLLYRFAAEGAVELRRTEFMITDREKLTAYAKLLPDV